MIDEKLIKSIVERSIDGTNMFIVDVKIAAGNNIEVVLDSDTSVTLENCIAVNRAVEAAFNRDEEDYALTVYSAGLSEPIKLLRQYIKHLGKEVELLLKSGKKVKGTLTAATADTIELSTQVKEVIEGKKRKQLVDKTERYDLNQIKITKLVINFK